MPRIARLGSLLALSLLAATGCASSATSAAGPGDPETDAAPSVTIDNCGEEVVFATPPERVALLESAPVTILDGLGVLDRVVVRAGTFPAEYYDADLAARIDGIPVLSEEIDASGHLMISSEVVIAQQPDLVLGLPEGLTREGLRDAGANTLIQPVYCPGGVGDATFASLYDQVESLGAVFDRPREAAALVASLEQRVATVRAETQDAAPRTAAVLYPSVGGGPVYAYGRASMAQPQLEAAGFENVFDDRAERVFEVGVEELIARDPEVLILLYQGDEAGVRAEVEGLPGADAMRAVRDGAVLVQLFNFTEPPTPLAVDGLERIVAHFDESP